MAITSVCCKPVQKTLGEKQKCGDRPIIGAWIAVDCAFPTIGLIDTLLPDGVTVLNKNQTVNSIIGADPACIFNCMNYDVASNEREENLAYTYRKAKAESKTYPHYYTMNFRLIAEGCESLAHLGQYNDETVHIILQRSDDSTASGFSYELIRSVRVGDIEMDVVTNCYADFKVEDNTKYPPYCIDQTFADGDLQALLSQ